MNKFEVILPSLLTAYVIYSQNERNNHDDKRRDKINEELRELEKKGEKLSELGAINKNI